MKNTLYTLSVGVVALLLQACNDDDFKNIESDLLGDVNFTSGTYSPDLLVENKSEEKIQTDASSSLLLGHYTQNPFGTKKAKILSQVSLPSTPAVFGRKTKASEDSDKFDEQEKVLEAYLYIPFFSRKTTNINNQNQQVNNYALDSIYGKNDATFDVQVKESNYFLRDIDPNAGFSVNQVYYSNLNVSSQLGTTIGEANHLAIKNEGIKRFHFDNPSTTEDESKNELDELAPGLRIALNPDFFQHKLFDKEGDVALSTSQNFVKYFRGVHISVEILSKNLMMLLNLNEAKIELVYSYKAKVQDKEQQLKDRYEMKLSGIRVNVFENTGENIPTFANNNDVKNIYLSGALGQVAELTLLSDADLKRMREEQWIINDASLLLFVDQSVTYEKEPERLYIYNAETGLVLADYALDATQNASSNSSSMLSHLGKLQKENKKGVYYRLRITQHVADIVRNNAKNVKVGIAVASNVNLSISSRDGALTEDAPIIYFDANNKKKLTKRTTITTPLSTVIYGNSSSVPAEKRLKLQISYTKPK